MNFHTEAKSGVSSPLVQLRESVLLIRVLYATLNQLLLQLEVIYDPEIQVILFFIFVASIRMSIMAQG